MLGDLPADAILPVAMSTVGVHGFGCWASVQLSLLNSSNSCSTSAELCTTVATEEDETVVVISCPDFHKLCSDTTCERGEGVQGVLTLFCSGAAQVCHDDRVVELKEQLEVEEEDGERQRIK